MSKSSQCAVCPSVPRACPDPIGHAHQTPRFVCARVPHPLGGGTLRHGRSGIDGKTKNGPSVPQLSKVQNDRR
jgi:hypothetical protein